MREGGREEEEEGHLFFRLRLGVVVVIVFVVGVLLLLSRGDVCPVPVLSYALCSWVSEVDEDRWRGDFCSRWCF